MLPRSQNPAEDSSVCILAQPKHCFSATRCCKETSPQASEDVKGKAYHIATIGSLI